MKKFFPYIPLFVLLFGVTIVQIGSNNHLGGVMSNVFNTSEVTSQSIQYCTKPEKFIIKDEVSWCHESTVENIQKHKNTWNWQCKNGEEIKACTFTETKDYPVRGGTYFSQK